MICRLLVIVRRFIMLSRTTGLSNYGRLTTDHLAHILGSSWGYEALALAALQPKRARYASLSDASSAQSSTKHIFFCLASARPIRSTFFCSDHLYGTCANYDIAVKHQWSLPALNRSFYVCQTAPKCPLVITGSDLTGSPATGTLRPAESRTPSHADSFFETLT